MSNKLRKLNKAFDTKVASKAKKIAEKYEIILTEENGEWYGRGLEIPTVFGDGKTPNECAKNTKEALFATVAHLLEQGKVVPAPANKGNRSEQVNVRLTVEEKAILSASAQARGFHSLADFFRTKALTPQP
ncbi:MAG: type II toxin-antitoxin system HicB family antitoxin [Sedimentisphaerales bacterium]|nr:type II toxin-antitoxin system HicB family antitoxin [Sedimentisphaerales bacterium]